jgi:hypothetical protein
MPNKLKEFYNKHKKLVLVAGVSVIAVGAAAAGWFTGRYVLQKKCLCFDGIDPRSVADLIEGSNPTIIVPTSKGSLDINTGDNKSLAVNGVIAFVTKVEEAKK